MMTYADWGTFALPIPLPPDCEIMSRINDIGLLTVVSHTGQVERLLYSTFIKIVFF